MQNLLIRSRLWRSGKANCKNQMAGQAGRPVSRKSTHAAVNLDPIVRSPKQTETLNTLCPQAEHPGGPVTFTFYWKQLCTVIVSIISRRNWTGLRKA